MQDIWAVNNAGGGWNPPYEKQSIAEATIVNLHQQLACHMIGVMFNVHLMPCLGR